MIVERRDGRHVSYLSQRDRDRIEQDSRRHQEDKLESSLDKVRAYQDQVRDGRFASVTAQDIIDETQSKLEAERQLQQQAHQQQPQENGEIF